MAFPINSIVMWFKPIAERPAGWQLCDGTNGTPDLRGKFVVGISQDGDRGVVQGNLKHSHTNSSVVGDGDHIHDVLGNLDGNASYRGITTVGGGGGSAAVWNHTHVVDFDLPSSGTHVHTTSNTAETDNLPPNIQVFYIMKVT